MNNNQRQVRPAFRAVRPNQPRYGNLNSYYPNPHGPIARARPPSFSRAPWDITRWVDPIQAQKAQLTKP